jgi:hypothetical protein
LNHLGLIKLLWKVWIHNIYVYENKFEKDIIRFDKENKDLANHDYIGLIILVHLGDVWLVFGNKKEI